MPILESYDEIARVLTKARTIAVVGLSDKEWRDSHSVAKFMKAKGYQIIPVNPTLPSVFGIPSHSSLAEVKGQVDIVDVFRRAEFVPDIVRDAIAIGAGTLWLQSGIVHEEAARRASLAGMNVIMDCCIAVAHTLLIR